MSLREAKLKRLNSQKPKVRNTESVREALINSTKEKYVLERAAFFSHDFLNEISDNLIQEINNKITRKHIYQINRVSCVNIRNYRFPAYDTESCHCLCCGPIRGSSRVRGTDEHYDYIKNKLVQQFPDILNPVVEIKSLFEEEHCCCVQTGNGCLSFLCCLSDIFFCCIPRNCYEKKKGIPSRILTTVDFKIAVTDVVHVDENEQSDDDYETSSEN